jgi:hypothetical protein
MPARFRPCAPIRWITQTAADVAPADLAAEVAQAVAEFAERWPRERTLDRVRLRLRLYETAGI